MQSPECYHRALTAFGFTPILPAPAGCPRYQCIIPDMGVWVVGCDGDGWYCQWVTTMGQYGPRERAGERRPHTASEFRDIMAAVAYRTVQMG